MKNTNNQKTNWDWTFISHIPFSGEKKGGGTPLGRDSRRTFAELTFTALSTNGVVASTLLL